MNEVLSNSASELKRSNDLMRELLAFGASLSAEQDFKDFVEKIVFTAKSLCCADAGILYLQESCLQKDVDHSQSNLDCVIVQIDSQQLSFNLLQSSNSLLAHPIASLDLATQSQSFAAQAALSGTLVETTNLSNKPDWSLDRDFDQDYNYSSISGLAVPFYSSDQQVLGVLKLLNARHPDTREIQPFDETLCEIMRWFAAQVSDALNDRRLLRNQADWVKADQEIQVGRQIQLDFLPEALPEIQGWEIAARFYPARDVAGDFYDAFSMGHGRIGIVIADVCDKGVGAALFMSLFRSFLRILAQQNYSLNLLDALVDGPSAKPRQDARSRLPSIGTQALKNAMERTNNYIAETHWRTNMFATIFFGVLDPCTGKLIYINGGHESPFVCDAQGKVKQRLDKTGPAVGVFPKAEFRIELVQLEPGDILLGFTDGVIDARSPQRERYTEQRLCQLVESTAIDSATALLDKVDTSVHAHIAEVDPFDDITLIAVRRNV